MRRTMDRPSPAPPAPARDGSHLVEAIPDPLPVLRWDAGAPVLHPEQHPLPLPAAPHLHGGIRGAVFQGVVNEILEQPGQQGAGFPAPTAPARRHR